MIRIKREPELQHILAHFRVAIDSLADGFPEAAKMEMRAIEATIEYDSLEEQESFNAPSQEAEQSTVS